MKTSRFVVLLAFLSSFVLRTSAQDITPPLNAPNYSKTRIFTDLPERMSLRITDAEALLDLPVGTRVKTTLADGFMVSGIIVSKSNPTDTTVRSVVISTDRKGATLTFSRVKGADGTISFTGRMLNRANGDALEIAREAQGYVIRKKGLYDMINE